MSWKFIVLFNLFAGLFNLGVYVFNGNQINLWCGIASTIISVLSAIAALNDKED